MGHKFGLELNLPIAKDLSIFERRGARLSNLSFEVERVDSINLKVREFGGGLSYHF